MAKDPEFGYKVVATVTDIKGKCSARHTVGESFELCCHNMVSDPIDYDKERDGVLWLWSAGREKKATSFGIMPTGRPIRLTRWRESRARAACWWRTRAPYAL